MKILKLAKAEVKKIFLRPIIFIVFLALIGTLVVLTLNFKPIPRTETKITAQGLNIQSAYNAFLNETNKNGKTQIEKILIDQRDEILEFLTKIESGSQLQQFKDKIRNAEVSMNFVHNAVVGYKSVPADYTLQEVKDAFATLKSDCESVVVFMDGVLSEQITFYISEKDFEFVKNFFQKIANNIPNNFANPDTQFVDLNNFLKTNFDFNQITPITTNLKVFPVTTESFSEVLTKYSSNILDETNYANTSPALNGLANQIADFVSKKSESTKEEDFITLGTYFSNYKSLATMASIVLKNEFQIAMAGDKTDNELRKYIGFSDYNGYILKQEAKLYSYLIENNSFDYNYLLPFSYNRNSGQTTNAFDFTVYAMQILSLVIAIFSIFIASGTIATEQANGTMKMIAIRPYSRSKIVLSKFLSCLVFATIITTIALITSFTVGFISYGIDQTTVLTIFDATNIVPLNAFLLLLIYFGSTLLNIFFYVAIALFLSVLVRSNTVSVIISMLIYAVSLIASIYLFKFSWFVFLPMAHFDLYKYFGATVNTGEFFSFILPLNASFDLSLSVLVSVILVTLLLSIAIFRKRNIA